MRQSRRGAITKRSATSSPVAPSLIWRARRSSSSPAIPGWFRPAPSIHTGSSKRLRRSRPLRHRSRCTAAKVDFGALPLRANSMAQYCLPARADRGDAFENFEIAAYKSLLALCGNAGVDSARAPLEASLKEGERMAAWVASNVEKVTLDYVSREQRRAA